VDEKGCVEPALSAVIGTSLYTGLGKREGPWEERVRRNGGSTAKDNVQEGAGRSRGKKLTR
jgi:hypothetical protein